MASQTARAWLYQLCLPKRIACSGCFMTAFLLGNGPGAAWTRQRAYTFWGLIGNGQEACMADPVLVAIYARLDSEQDAWLREQRNERRRERRAETAWQRS